MADKIATIIRFHREWLEKNGSRILDRDSKYLKEDIEDGSAQSFQQIPDSLDGLATYFGVLGTVEVLDGSNSGWKNIAAAIDFRGWGLKIRSESFFRDLGVPALNLTNYVSRAACLVCVSEKWAEMAEGVLRHVDRNSDAVDKGYWESRRFEPFVLQCCKIRDGEAIDAELGTPYNNVLRNWNDEVSLAMALESVCQYHCDHMDDTGGDWDPEFKYTPFELLPCEVMLVSRIREQLGLSMPMVSHHLMSALSSGASIIADNIEHELLQKLAMAFKRCYV